VYIVLTESSGTRTLFSALQTVIVDRIAGIEKLQSSRLCLQGGREMKKCAQALLTVLAIVGIAVLCVRADSVAAPLGASSCVSSLLPVREEIADKLSVPALLVQGKRHNEYGAIPPKAPDYSEYYGFGLPAYPPYGSSSGSSADSKSYFPYGGKYPSYGDSFYKYKACPPWAAYPYEC
jgi:hypothetical protein